MGIPMPPYPYTYFNEYGHLRFGQMGLPAGMASVPNLDTTVDEGMADWQRLKERHPELFDAEKPVSSRAHRSDAPA